MALSNGTRASNGFVALAELDTNNDALIDENDTIWTKLLLGRDWSHDGVSQSHEIRSVTDSGLAAISLEHHWTGRRDRSGNTYRYESKVWIRDTAKHVTARPVYDIFFVAAP